MVKEREIEYLQNALYKAHMSEMSVYENGDMLIGPVNSKYVKDGIISISKNELLLIDDETGERYGKTYQDVYDILVDWCVIDEMNLTPKEMQIVLRWLKKHDVKINESDNEYSKLGGTINE